MKIKTAWGIQSFLLCFLFNLALGALIFHMADRGLDALNQWISPLTGAGASALPEDLRTALGGFGTFVVEARGYLMPLLGALTAAITFLLWLVVFLAGGRQIRRAGERTALSSVPEVESRGAEVAQP